MQIVKRGESLPSGQLEIDQNTSPITSLEYGTTGFQHDAFILSL